MPFKPRYPFRQEVFGGIAYDPLSEDFFHLNDTAYGVLEFLDAQNISQESLPTLPQPLVSGIFDLQASGLVEQSTNHLPRHTGRLTHSQVGLLAAPTTVELYPTFLCNERCSFCYVGYEVESARPTDTWGQERLPALARELSKAGVFNVIILGGEPFLYRHLGALLEALAAERLDVALSTNGTLYQEDLLETIARCNIKLNIALHSCIASVHNSITRSNTFQKVSSFARKAAHAGLNLHITIVLHPENLGSIEDTVEYVAQLGAKAVTISYPQPARYAVAHGAVVSFQRYRECFRAAVTRGSAHGLRVHGNCHYNFLVDEYSSGFDPSNPLADLLYGDKAGRSRVEVSSNGDIYPSSSLFGQLDWKVGNIFSDDLLTVWEHSEALNRIRGRILPPECSGCLHRIPCGGGIIGDLIAKNRWNLPPEDCPILKIPERSLESGNAAE